MNVNWNQFWQTYRRAEVKEERDLYYEVGKTINGQRISQAAFALAVELIVRELDLQPDDRLTELCCGNGLMTVPLVQFVREVQAVDFAEHLIEHAREFRRAPNVNYICADAVAYMRRLAADKSYVPTKILLSDGLGYFNPQMLGDILRSTINLTTNRFMFLATGIPCDELKWNFYDTPERIRRFEENQRREVNTNDGLGRWWRRAELEQLAIDYGLTVAIRDQPAELSTYRVDATFEPIR